MYGAPSQAMATMPSVRKEATRSGRSVCMICGRRPKGRSSMSCCSWPMDRSRSTSTPCSRRLTSRTTAGLATPLRYVTATLVLERSPISRISVTKSGVRKIRCKSVRFVRMVSLKASCGAKAALSMGGWSTARLAKPGISARTACAHPSQSTAQFPSRTKSAIFLTPLSSFPVPVGSTCAASAALRPSGAMPPKGRMFISGRSTMSSRFLRFAMPSM